MIASAIVALGKKGWRPLAGGAVVSLLIAALVVVTGSPAGAADRAFGIRYQANEPGNIAFAANTVMTCPASAPLCAAAQAGGSTDNNNFVMRYVDADGDVSTFDSSTADLSLPSGASVLFAGLYWGADTSAGVGGSAAPTPSAKGTVQFAVPGSPYTAVTASQVDTSTSLPNRYQGFADVTSLVQGAGSGTYGVADVQAGTGNDRYGGWAMIVAYHDGTQPPRNLTVFDGFQTVSGANPTVDIPVSGFLTPTSGPVRTTLGFMAYEGDRGMVGDTASLNGTTLTDAVNPANNFFNSTIANLGTLVTSKNPDYANQLGYDADLVNANGILANGATSAVIHTHTGGETFLPGAVSFATELFSPDVVPGKSGVDLNGAPLEPGDVIEYRITGTNTGEDGATNFSVTDPIPNDTSYVANSLDIVSSPGGIAGPKTDAPGDDQGEVNGSSVVFRVGTGADAVSGGTLAPGDSFEVRFRVRVDTPTLDGTIIRNRASDSMDAQTTPGLNLNQNSPETTLTVLSPDLVLAKTDSGSFVRGAGTGSFHLTVANQGSAPSSGSITVDDTLPASMVPSAAAGTGWSCTVVGQDVSCSRSDPLASGASFPGITVSVDVSQSAPNSVTNTAAVSGGNDGDLGNNSASDTVSIASSADLAIDKSVSPVPPIAGAPITYTLQVSDLGPSDATGVTVTDPLPTQLISPLAATSQGSCAIAAGTLTCPLGPIASGAGATIQVTGILAAGAAGQTIDNTASVSGNETDPDLSNNSSSVSNIAAASADLSIDKTLSPMPPVAGAPATYTLQVSNVGPSDATGVTVTDPLPAQLTGPVATPSQGSCAIAGGTLTCSLGAIASGTGATIQVTGTVTPGTAGQTLSNTATVSGTEPDPDTTNNSSTVTATIEVTRLGLRKTADSSTVAAGGDVGFTIRLRVSGPVAAQGVRVCDSLPAHMTFVSAPGGTFQGGRVCWTFATLAPGSIRILTVRAHVDTDAPTGLERNIVRASSSNAGRAQDSALVRITAAAPGGPIPPVTG